VFIGVSISEQVSADRYYGYSSPYEILDNEALQYLTLNNSVADMVRFARDVDLPFDTNHSSNAPQAVSEKTRMERDCEADKVLKAWIQVGGSYSGALAAWNEKISPGTYWAYHASSGPVEAVYDYWSYFLPIQAGMPKNCSKDMERIVEHVDAVIEKGDADEIAKLQKSFGLQELTHVEDFAAYDLFPDTARELSANPRIVAQSHFPWASGNLSSNIPTTPRSSRCVIPSRE
jgi:hypothetical protein